jgi:hypothetical protein
MIVAINRVDKSCLSAGDIAVRKHFCRTRVALDQARAYPSHHRCAGIHDAIAALLLVIGALMFVSATACAVDRRQFENVPEDIRAWFKGVRSPADVPFCDISDGYRWQSGREELVLLCASCDRPGRSAWPELAPGLTPDSIKQKYAQTVVSMRIVPGCVQFLREEKSFYTVWTRPGHRLDRMS